jgi:hypothetical protein
LKGFLLLYAICKGQIVGRYNSSDLNGVNYMALRYLLLGLMFSIAVVACSQGASVDSPTPYDVPSVPPNTAIVIQSSLSPTNRSGTPSPLDTAQVFLTENPSPVSPPTTSIPSLDPEAILILEPGPGSILTSPLQIKGFADPAFEQTLVVNVLLEDGTQLLTEPINIRADVGQRGPFSAQIPFTINEPHQAFIQVYNVSPRDGGLIHLASVGVTLSDSGEQKVLQAVPHLEQIAIFKPKPAQEISGGSLLVEGFALAEFEQTLVVEIQDLQGRVIGMQPVIVNAPDLGQPGPFSLGLLYQVDVSGPGRVVVRDISPAFGGDVHLSSVEIKLSP